MNNAQAKSTENCLQCGQQTFFFWGGGVSLLPETLVTASLVHYIKEQNVT